MPSKKKAKKHPTHLAALFEPHAFWKGDDAAGVALIEQLALHYGVNAPFGLFLTDGPTSRPRAERWASLALLLAGDLYPAFKKLPSKGGTPHRLPLRSLFWPYADEARLVQLFDDMETHLTLIGEPSRNDDVFAKLIKKYAGKFPNWRLNGICKLSSLKKKWEKIPPEVMAHPECHLPVGKSISTEWPRSLLTPGEYLLSFLPPRLSPRGESNPP